MDVWVDGRWSGPHGIGRYSAEITSRLPYAVAATSARVRPASPLDPWWLGLQLARHRPDLYFTPGFNVAASRTPQFVVLHDLIHLHVREESTPLKRTYYERLVRPAVLRTGRVATVSEFSKRTIVEWCGIDPHRVTVAPGALSDAFLSADSFGDASVLPDVGPYVLYVGNGKPHKNVRLLFDAMTSLTDLALVCVGLRDEDLPDHEESLRTRLTLLRSISDHALAALYRRAECLAFPSLYEGFGLPALEALSQGVPVAYVSEAVRETVGSECGVRSDPDASPREFARCIERTIGLRPDPGFTEAAAARVAAYSWETSAQRIAAGIEDCLGSR